MREGFATKAPAGDLIEPLPSISKSGSKTTITTSAELIPPSSSEPVTFTVNTPALVNLFVLVQRPPTGATVDVGPPPSKLNEHFNTSLVPGSAIDATIATVVPTLNTDPDGGLVTAIVGATLATVSAAFFDTGALRPSLAVSVSVNVPSSVHVIVVSSAAGAAITHVAPASTPTPGANVHVVVTGSPSGSTAVAWIGMADPSVARGVVDGDGRWRVDLELERALILAAARIGGRDEDEGRLAPDGRVLPLPRAAAGVGDRSD